MKKIIKFILIKISRVIFWIIPKEFHRPNSGLAEKLDQELINETVNHFKEHIKKSIIFTNIWKIREYAIQSSLLNDKHKEYYYLEFGVWKGRSSNFFSKFVNKLYCFDSFEGLKEDCVGENFFKGHFNLNKKIPSLLIQPNDGEIVLFPSSLFHSTIPIKKNEERIVIAFDMMPLVDK